MRRFIRKLFAKSVSPVVSKKPARARLGLESMESREVLSTASLTNGILTITGTNGNEFFELRAANANSVTVLDHGSVIGDFPFSSPVISAINLNAGQGIDSLVVTGLPALVGGRLTVTGADAVTIGKNVGTAAVPKFSLAEVRSEVFINSPTFFQVAGDAATDSKFVNLSASSIIGLSPKPIFYSQSGDQTLILTTGSANDTINVNSTPTGGTVQLVTNDGGDTVNVAANNDAIKFIGGAGTDTLNVAPSGHSLDPINGRIDFTGGDGTDVVSVNDQSGAGIGPNLPGNFIYNATVTASQITRQAASLVPGFPFNETATIGYSGAELVTYTAADQALAFSGRVRVASTSGSTLVNAGGQQNVIVGDGTLNGIHNPVTVNRTVLGGTLTIDDSAQTLGHTYDLGATSVTEPGIPVITGGLAALVVPPFGFPPSQSISFNGNVQTVKLLAGSGADKINVNALRGGAALYSVDAGGGSDTLTAPNRDNVFTLGSPNSATLDAVVSLFKVENLVGNAKDDKFSFFFNDGTIDGSINGGGGGFDTLDYSQFAIPVSVNLASGFATHVGGSQVGRVSGIENVFGGAGADVIVGSSANNVLVGNGGIDFISGAGGADLLIGGDGADTLTNRPGTAIYVGGLVKGALTTDAGLKAVEAEWARTDLTGTAEQQFAAKVSHLKLGGGLNGSVKLDGTTVAADHQADKLDPNPSPTAFDLFVIDLQDTFQGTNTPSDAEKARQIVVL